MSKVIDIFGKRSSNKKSVINFERIKEINETNIPSQLNCWGATLYALNEKNTKYWVEERQMWRWLKENTTKLEYGAKLMPGDIYVTRAPEHVLESHFGENNGLVHTALYVGNGKYWHKCGQEPAEYASLKKVMNSYHFDGDFGYHVRLNKQIKNGGEAA